ncbi:MAG: GlxA family transcriptional regulator [Verrucomicrobiaceae bacterium]|nr:MAG: GlxA family transcriptional regulator [Verrucomicrobiaceae bacterium]
MPVIPEIQPKPRTDRLVVFVAFPDMGLLDMTGAYTVLWAASRIMAGLGMAGYRCRTVSPEGGLIRTAEGLEISTEPITGVSRAAIHTLMVPGSPHMPRLLDGAGVLIRGIQRLSGRARRTASVCSGTFLLARAGLLDGKRAATHWAMCGELGKRFPSVRVDSDAIFVREGTVWTSAGVSAGIDLALALVEEDCGRETAMKVAREMVVFLKRPGGQSQHSELLQSQDGDKGAFEELHLWIAANLGRKHLPVEALAARAGMSPRNFARVYKQKTGRTPARAVEVLRLEAARRLLEESGQRSISQIADDCGFGDDEHMRAAFQRHLGVSPRDYRRRFAK